MCSILRRKARVQAHTMYINCVERDGVVVELLSGRAASDSEALDHTGEG